MKSILEHPIAESALPNALSPDDLASIVQRGSGMYERLSADFETVEGPASDQARHKRLQDWKELVAAGDDERFQRRIRWDGLSKADLDRMLGTVRLRDGSALPAWARLLGELTTELSPEMFGLPLRSCCREEEPVQFEHLFSPLVGMASRRLLSRCATSRALFSQRALDGLERSLLRRLAIFLSETLYLEFEIFRSRLVSDLDLLVMRSRGDQSDEIYRAFLENLFSGGLRELWLEYPVLARLVAIGIESWIDASADLMERLHADGTEIGAWLSPGEPLEVAEVNGLLSDSHHHGRSVSILQFSSGSRLVYKPRPVSNEAEWCRLLDWLNRRQGAELFRCLRVIERPAYGWVEPIAAEPLENAEAATRYFRRCGMLLALTYAVGVNDLHFENLIAVGEHPVLIDLETVLCHSPTETIQGVSIDDMLRTVFFESPLRTGLLPRWQLGHGAPVDVSALGAVFGQNSRVPVPQWKDLNRDLMMLSYETIEGKSGPNAAVLDGQVLPPDDYLEQIIGGFEEMYRLLMLRGEEMLEAQGPLGRLSELHVRFIFRATAFYLLTAKGSRLPHLLRDGADRSIHLEPIAAPLLLARSKPSAWPLLELERQALEIEDCPHFSAPVNSDTIDGPAGIPLTGILEAACFEQMKARFRRLCAEDMENHVGLIRASFDSRSNRTAHSGPRPPGPNEPSLQPRTRLSSAELLEEAARLADGLLKKSISGGTRPPHWVTLRHLETIGRNQLDPIGPDLFEGRAGVALTLAALYRVSGSAKYAEAARQIATALGEELAGIDPRYLPPDVLVHGLTGIASLAYVFRHLSDLLEDPSLSETALRAVHFLTAETISADHRFDVLSGAAGSILAALCVDRDEATDRAVACATHLLSTRSSEKTGARCWHTFEDRPISGFSHGNSGIAYALLRLAAASEDRRFSEAAVEALSWEDGTFSEAEGNWPDLRWPEISYAAGWCHGAPGMALPRAEAIALKLDYAAGPYLQAAVATITRHLGGGPDHICCGNFGRVLLLHALGQRLARADWITEAEELAAALVERARTAGGYRLMRQYAGYVSFPGLFQGVSGIAYALLRLGFPEAIPDLIELK